MNRVGVMQGRLSPRPPERLQAFPGDRWRQELSIARDCGFDCLEWIFEAPRAFENPIWSRDGRRRIRDAVSETGVSVRSVCADYFMVHRLAGDRPEATQRAVTVLQQLVERAADVGAERILVPLLESSAVESPELRDEVVESLARCMPVAERCGVTLALEMDVDGASYASLVRRLGSRWVRAYYDTGNSAARGLDVARDVCRVLPVLSAVHVKDRLLAGPSVPLGTGAADLPGLFEAVSRYGFAGDFVLQTWFGDDYLYDTLRSLNYVRVQLARAKRKAA